MIIEIDFIIASLRLVLLKKELCLYIFIKKLFS